MRALCAVLGNPERAFRSLHVVGTNGKTSVTLITAALLGAAGVRAGACVSPHTFRWRERTRVAGTELGENAFAAATGEVAAAIDRLRGGVPAGEPGSAADPPSQFEAAIAISFVAFRAAGVEVAVIEAGLGGRLDATNVIASEATALTSVALDHTEWLGSTTAEIATEKLAVLEPGTVLVVGRLEPEIEAAARQWAEQLGSRFVVAPEAAADHVPDRYGPYLRRNAGVARELVAVVAEQPAAAVSRAALEHLALGGRLEMIPGDPPLLVDVAHNEEGAIALAEALEPLARPRLLCVSVLADKDAAAIAAALAPQIDVAVCTAADPGPAMGRPGARALEPSLLAGHFTAAGLESEVVPEPAAALQRALTIAGLRGGVAICAGSNYLLRYVWTAKRGQSSSR